MRTRRMGASALAWAVLFLMACPGGPTAPPLPDCPPYTDDLFPVLRPPCAMDLLFVIDNGSSMAEEQASLAAQLPHLFDALARGELRDDAGDVVRVFQPITSLQVGVVDTDMGAGGHVVPTCDSSDFGDDGILRTRGNTTRPGCAGSYPSFLWFARGHDSTALADDVACVTTLGTTGCGFRQPLEAALKALTPLSASTRFADGTRGHGDLENAGFLRAHSLLVWVLLSDHDDCSASDADLFNDASVRHTGGFNLRCSTYPEAMYPMSRYAAGLSDLPRTHPEDLVFAAIVGVPVELAQPPGYVDYEALLADPRMQQRPDPSMPSRLTPSCEVAGRGMAFPPLRLLALASELQDLGAVTTVQSICQEDLTPATDAILVSVANALHEPRCQLYSPPPRDADGRVDCELLAKLPSSGTPTTCAELSALEPTPVRVDVEDDGPHEICRVRQLPMPPSGSGWYLDDFTPDARAS